MINIFAVIVTVLTGLVYFVLGQGLWLLPVLLLVIVFTRFREKTRELGKYVEMLFFFCLISVVINELGINYPYSLILILAALVILIFYEGPEWGRLYFSVGKTKEFTRHSLLGAFLGVILLGGYIFFRRNTLYNPVPLSWPIDALIIVGLGFAFYICIMEELLFRSFIYQRAEAATSPGLAVLLQGIFFGLMQYRIGVPSGLAGIVLGTLLGIALGYLVKKTNSIYLSMFARFIIVFVIFCELAILGKYQI